MDFYPEIVDQLVRDVGKDTIPRLLEKVQDSLSQALPLVYKYNQNGDSNSLERTLHSLRSTVATFGLLTLAENLEAQERSLVKDQNSGKEINSLMEQIRITLEDVIPQIEDYLEETHGIRMD